MGENQKINFLAGALIISTFFFGSASLANEVIGRFSVASGDVKIIAADGKERKVKPGDDIFNDDTINTAAGSSVKILFSDKSVIDLGPNSSFKVSDYKLGNVDDRSSTFSLAYGKLRSLVTKKVGPAGKVNYRAGSSVMGVRGTEFISSLAKGSETASVAVMSGVVSVSAAGMAAPMNVSSGQMMSFSSAAIPAQDLGAGAAGAGAPGAGAVGPEAGGGATAAAGASSPGAAQPAQVQQMDSGTMKQMTSEATTADNTFSSAVTISNEGQSGGGNMAMNAVAGIVSDAMAATGEQMSKLDMSELMADAMMNNQSFLPPIMMIPGSPVQMTITVVK